jgi:hypothetical protein
MDRLTQIEERLANATPGPWVDGMGTHGNPADGPEFCEVRTEPADERTRGITIAELPLEQQAAQDAELIAHAPADLAALVAVVREVKALHQSRPNSTSALYPKPLCTCGVVWENCPTAAAVQKLGEA